MEKKKSPDEKHRIICLMCYWTPHYVQLSWLSPESKLIQTLSTLDDAQQTVNYAEHLRGKLQGQIKNRRAE